MEILFVRHAESEGNAQNRMQGRRDYDLSETGRGQVRLLASWLVGHGITWDVAYCSPLSRARRTAEQLSELVKGPQPSIEPDLSELHAGELEGLTRDEMAELFPEFLGRPVTEIGDFSAFGGECYDEVQSRARRLLAEMLRRHRPWNHRVLMVGHGGFNFQLLKLLICAPVPRVCILRMGNGAATLVRMQERRGSYMGEVVWHIPLELMGGRSGEGIGGAFR